MQGDRGISLLHSDPVAIAPDMGSLTRRAQEFKNLEIARVRSRISARVENVSRSPSGRYLGYINPRDRYSQAVPPDPPWTTEGSDSPPTLESFGEESDSSLDDIPLIRPFVSQTPPDTTTSTTPQTTPSNSPPVTPSFPASAAPPIPPTPNIHPSFSDPCVYPPAAIATERDFGLDYESVMMCIQDLHGITKFVCGRGGSGPRQTDPTGVEVSRDEVVESLAMLHVALNRMFSRLNLD